MDLNIVGMYAFEISPLFTRSKYFSLIWKQKQKLLLARPTLNRTFNR